MNHEKSVISEKSGLDLGKKKGLGNYFPRPRVAFLMSLSLVEHYKKKVGYMATHKETIQPTPIQKRQGYKRKKYPSSMEVI